MAICVQEADLSSDQKDAFTAISKWLQSKAPLLTMGGYAGSGKSTIMSLLPHTYPHMRIVFCAFTGKATGVLRNKLKESGAISGNVICETIHSVIYRPLLDRNGSLKGFDKRKDLLDLPFGVPNLIIVDEASMVSRQLFEDLASFGVPILAVGDHGQLPPVGDNFSLIFTPDIRLEKVHRQAEGNPIIQLATHIRTKHSLTRKAVDGKHVRFLPESAMPFELDRLFRNKKPEDVLDTALLCYTNSTRVMLNKRARSLLLGSQMKSHAPFRSDVLVCLKNIRSVPTKGSDKGATVSLYNGCRGFFVEDPKLSEDKLRYQGCASFPDDFPSQVVLKASAQQFNYPKTISDLEAFAEAFKIEIADWYLLGHLFDYGYALTVHKFQGSSAKDVVICYERPGPVDTGTFARWLYTAVTRSSDRLTIVGIPS